MLQLSNGQYSVRLSDVGSGYSELGGIAVTRWVPDETQDADGFFIYLRDLDDYTTWSAGLQPTRTVPHSYEFRPGADGAEIVRTDHQITSQLTICVAPRHNFEVRRCLVTNVGDRTRRLELTSYLEWVLGSGEADANHPAFSKLFVETQFCSERSAILARRRPRHSDDSEFWGFHSVVSEGGNFHDELEFETNRMRFIGRGRTMASPLALDPGVILTGDCGSVLDPIASFRANVSLEPGEARAVAFVMGAAPTRTEIDEMLAAVGDMSQVQSVLDEAKTAVDSAQWLPRPIAKCKWRRGWQDRRRPPGAPARSPSPEYTSKYHRATSMSGNGEAKAAKLREPLQLENGFGGFSADGQEYVIRLVPDGHGGHRHPPMPWTNVISNAQAGFLVSERGAGYTWSGNSRVNRLTAWHNDPVVDPHGEAIWIRDEDAGSFWSPTPGPSPAPDEYRVRHGFGYTIFEHDSHELSEEVTMFMAPDDPVKVIRLRIANRSERTRRFSVFSYLHWALGGLPSETANGLTTEHDEAAQCNFGAQSPPRAVRRECRVFRRSGRRGRGT